MLEGYKSKSNQLLSELWLFKSIFCLQNFALDSMLEPVWSPWWSPQRPLFHVFQNSVLYLSSMVSHDWGVLDTSLGIWGFHNHQKKHRTIVLKVRLSIGKIIFFVPEFCHGLRVGSIMGSVWSPWDSHGLHTGSTRSPGDICGLHRNHKWQEPENAHMRSTTHLLSPL